MTEEEATFTYYALGIKGCYYSTLGEITEDFHEAKLFPTLEDAIAFRAKYDPAHRVDYSVVLLVQMLVSEV
jgi:hypothetical protein